MAHISKWLKMTKYTDNELHLLICTRSNQDFWICINLRSVMKLSLEVSQQVNSLCWDWSNGLFVVCAGGPVATRQCNWKVFGWHNCISAQGEFWCIWQTLQWQCTGTLLTCFVNHRVWTIFVLCLCHFTVLCWLISLVFNSNYPIVSSDHVESFRFIPTWLKAAVCMLCFSQSSLWNTYPKTARRMSLSSRDCKQCLSTGWKRVARGNMVQGGDKMGCLIGISLLCGVLWNNAGCVVGAVSGKFDAHTTHVGREAQHCSSNSVALW